MVLGASALGTVALGGSVAPDVVVSRARIGGRLTVTVPQREQDLVLVHGGSAGLSGITGGD